jgi:S1-C subfamily serine protease
VPGWKDTAEDCKRTMKQPDACVVRITNAQGETQGTGFLISTDGLIATCAHVVEGTEPCVAFPGGEPRPAQVVATDQAHDVAMLQLEGELPDEAEPVRLGRSSGAYDRGFRSRGYRPLGGLEGIPAKGEVLNAVSEAPGYPGVRYMPLVLQTQHVRGGMSGAPVYVPDLDLTVGMITSYWDSLKAGTGFADRDTALATPAEAIVALCPDIRLWEPPPELSRPLLGVPFQAPAVPRYFVPRPEVSDELKSHLLPDEPIAPGALVVSAVHGLGGIGKTTLVAALAHDPELQARFPDGVLWATLGHQPDVLSLLVGWIQALRDYNFRPTVIENASNHLRTLLHDKACLLVVDDAWQTDHVRPFLVGEDRCRVLVTTRDATLARKVGARLYDLDVMTEAQALALFEARLGPLDGHRKQAADLARELGYLPLALELAAAQVEAGYSWAELLDVFRREFADLAALDLDEPTYRNESLRLSFRMTLERLSPEDQYAFVWLGVLPEDARLSPSMAATLWDQSVADAHKRLRRLRDKALLKSVGNDQYTVHDLLHDEAKGS